MEKKTPKRPCLTHPALEGGGVCACTFLWVYLCERLTVYELWIHREWGINSDRRSIGKPWLKSVCQSLESFVVLRTEPAGMRTRHFVSVSADTDWKTVMADGIKWPAVSDAFKGIDKRVKISRRKEKGWLLWAKCSACAVFCCWITSFPCPPVMSVWAQLSPAALFLVTFSVTSYKRNVWVSIRKPTKQSIHSMDVYDARGNQRIHP